MSTPDFAFACPISDVPKKGAKNVNLNGQEITIFHTKDGFIAHSGVCKHNAFKLELCDISGDIVTCPLHGWKYSISTGRGIKPSWTCLDTYPLEVRDQEIWVQLIANEPDQDDIDTSSYQW